MGNQNGLSGEEIGELQRTFEQEYKKKMNMNEEELRVFNKEMLFMEAYACTKYLTGLQQASNDPTNSWHQALGQKKIMELMSFLSNRLSEITPT